MLPVIAFSMPTALVIYFVLSNLYRVASRTGSPAPCTAMTASCTTSP